MKKSMRMVSIMMFAVLSVSAMSAMAVSTSAQEVTASSYAQTMDETFDKSFDADAPTVNKTAFEKAASNAKAIGPYSAKEGQYYIAKTLKMVKAPGYPGERMAKPRKVAEYKLVKVERAFEDPTWFGTERTIDIRFCDSGQTRRVQPNKWFAPNVPLYEIGDFVC